MSHAIAEPTIFYESVAAPVERILSYSIQFWISACVVNKYFTQKLVIVIFSTRKTHMTFRIHAHSAFNLFNFIAVQECDQHIFARLQTLALKAHIFCDERDGFDILNVAGVEASQDECWVSEADIIGFFSLFSFSFGSLGKDKSASSSLSLKVVVNRSAMREDLLKVAIVGIVLIVAEVYYIEIFGEI